MAHRIPPNFPPRGAAPLPGKAGDPADLTPDELQARAQAAVAEMETLATGAIADTVGKLTGKLLAKGVVKKAGEGVYIPGTPVDRLPGYAGARDVPARLRRRAEFAIRRQLDRPRIRGAKPFRGEHDRTTMSAAVWAGTAVLWTDSVLFRAGLNAATSSAGPGFELPAGGLQGLGIAAGVAAGCSLLDGLDMFNAFLDTLKAQDRWKVEVVVFHRHFTQYLADRAAGSPSGPEVVHGFLRCRRALSRCALFNKAARQALRRCHAGTVRDTGLSSAGTLGSIANTGMKIYAGSHVASQALGMAGTGLGAASLPIGLACAVIDAWVGRGEVSSRKKEYRRHKACCRQIQRQIDQLTEATGAGHEDRAALFRMLQGARKQHRRLMKHARYNMMFGRVRMAKAAANSTLATPLGIAALVAGALGAAVAWPLGITGLTVGTTIGLGYLGAHLARSAAQHALQGRTRREQYDATTLATTTRADDRTHLLEEEDALTVAGTEGYWIGGPDGFAGRSVREVRPETHAAAALDEFAGLLARRAAGAVPWDAAVEAHILALLALVDIDERLFDDIESMIRARSDAMRARGAHPRDIEWHELMARREQYAAAFGLPADPPRMPPGALLPSFHAACWMVRLRDSPDEHAGTFARLLDRHLRGDQVDLHAMNEWLGRTGHLAASSPLTQAQMQAAADRLFLSVPPALFIEQTQVLLKAIAEETGDRKGFQWQDESPVLRDLTAFCGFAQAQWLPAHRLLSRVQAHPVDADRSLRACTTDELAQARRHLASGGALPSPWTLAEDRQALQAMLDKEWMRRFASASRGGRHRTCRALAEHCAIHRQFAGRPWASDATGNFHCDLGGRNVAVVRAAKLATWVTRGDWNHPLPIETRSRAPAAGMLWLTGGPGAGVDERFIRAAGPAPTLQELEASFERSAPHGSTKLRDRLITLDPAAGAGRSGCGGLREEMGQTRRLALAVPHGSSTRPWALLERTVRDGGEGWRLEMGGKSLACATLEEAVQACGVAFGQQDTVRAIFFTKAA